MHASLRLHIRSGGAAVSDQFDVFDGVGVRGDWEGDVGNADVVSG